MSFVAVGMGAAMGAWLRWGLALWLGGAHDKLQVGTLAANWGGGYLIGMAVMVFAGCVQWRWGIAAEGRSLEDVATPLSQVQPAGA